jgi:ribosomal protein L40E
MVRVIMPFQENIRKEVKRKAHYQCCMCRIPYAIEVHHIIPQKDGGGDEIDNAAPLCSNCHTMFGSNPEKRKIIREVRDFWYEICAKKEETPNYQDISNKLDEHYESLKKGQDDFFTEVKTQISSYFHKQGYQISKAATMDELVSTASGSTTASFFEESLSYISCQKCGGRMTIDAVYCSNCGAKL